jgi:hypothetical protein
VRVPAGSIKNWGWSMWRLVGIVLLEPVLQQLRNSGHSAPVCIPKRPVDVIVLSCSLELGPGQCLQLCLGENGLSLEKVGLAARRAKGHGDRDVFPEPAVHAVRPETLQLLETLRIGVRRPGPAVLILVTTP